VRVKLSPEMLDRVEKMAADYGMPSATFCAFAVGDFVRRSEQQAQLGRMAVMDAARRSGDAMDISDERLERIFSAMLPEIAKMAAEDKRLTLDQEEADKDSH
jgi:hypothetical protein